MLFENVKHSVESQEGQSTRKTTQRRVALTILQLYSRPCET